MVIERALLFGRIEDLSFDAGIDWIAWVVHTKIDSAVAILRISTLDAQFEIFVLSICPEVGTKSPPTLLVFTRLDQQCPVVLREPVALGCPTS